MLDGLAASVSRMIRPNALTRSHSSTSWIGSLGQVALAAAADRSTAADSAAANCGSALPECWPRRDTSCIPASRRTSSCRGSSISSSTSSLRGSTCCDLISISSAGHRQKIAHRVDVQLLQHRQVFEILVGDQRRWEYRRSPPRACAPGRATGPAGRGTRSDRRESPCGRRASGIRTWGFRNWAAHKATATAMIYFTERDAGERSLCSRRPNPRKIRVIRRYLRICFVHRSGLT